MKILKRAGLAFGAGFVLLAVSLVLLQAGPGISPVYAQGGDIHVAPGGTNSPACGAIGAPCRTIKYAVENRAQAGDRILAAAGTYTEPFTVMTTGLQLLGAGPALTVIDGESVRGPMVTFAPGLTASAVFSGFAVQNGITATTVHGGGVYLPDSSPTIRAVRVQANTGAGLYLAGSASPQVRGSIICGNSGFQLNNGGTAPADAAGNWWGTNTPLPGQTYTGSVTAAPPISVSVQLRQYLQGSGSLGSWGSGSLFVGKPAQITVTMRGGGYNPPPGTRIALQAAAGYFSGGVTTTTLLIVDGLAVTVFTPTGSAAVVSAFHACNPGQAVATVDYRRRIFLPLIVKNYPPPPPPPPAPTCPVTSTAQFSLLSTNGRADHPDYLHGDLNLSLRSYDPFIDSLGLVDYTGGTAGDPPQLGRMFGGNSFPGISAVYRVHDWIWDPAQCNGNPDGCRGPVLTYNPGQLRWWDVTLAGLTTRPGQTVYLPPRNSEIDPRGFKALVLYAEETRLTLGYTVDDTVANGYAVHLENVCVDPNLLALYRAQNNADGTRKTGKLPALSNGQALGTALADEMPVSVRDKGTFMDPRSRKDWWQGANRAGLPIEVRAAPRR